MLEYLKKKDYKNIKLQFKNKYNNIYYIDNIINYNNIKIQVQYLLSYYFGINNN